MNKCPRRRHRRRSIARDFGIELHTVVHSHATAASRMDPRRGLGGKTRHVNVQFLWIRDAVENKEFKLEKVGTLENPADMLNKFLAGDAHSKHTF